MLCDLDNMTAMLVLFEDGTSYQTEKDELILGPYQRDDKPDFKKSYEDNLLRLGVTLEQALDARKLNLIFCESRSR
jgi:hypothetical protein